ncbi:MAG: hypothetical protein JWQ89_2635, partial [Devosia sp.]|nr:hypothetical protein [Devosia sp.]
SAHEILDKIVDDLLPEARHIVDELGIDQVRANVARGLADMARRRAEREAAGYIKRSQP